MKRNAGWKLLFLDQEESEYNWNCYTEYNIGTAIEYWSKGLQHIIHM